MFCRRNCLRSNVEDVEGRDLPVPVETERTDMLSGLSSFSFPPASPGLEAFGLKFSSGGAHISRTIMLAELGAVLANVPPGSAAADYREAILDRTHDGRGGEVLRTCRCHQTVSVPRDEDVALL